MSRTVVMTISKIEADLLDVTMLGHPQQFVAGHIWVTATSGSEFRRWQLTPDERCFIGDTVDVTIIDQPLPGVDLHLDSPSFVVPYQLAVGDTLHDASVDQTWRWTGHDWEPIPSTTHQHQGAQQ